MTHALSIAIWLLSMIAAAFFGSWLERRWQIRRKILRQRETIRAVERSRAFAREVPPQLMKGDRHGHR